MFTSKTKGFVFDQNEQRTVLARVSSLEAPLTIEEWKEVPAGDDTALNALIATERPKKNSSYLFAKCGVNPDDRFIRRTSLDPKRFKEPNYLAEVANTQFRLDGSTHAIAVLSATDGSIFDPTRPASFKDVLFCGMSEATAKRLQQEIVARGIFPQSLEISSLLSLGALVDYLKFTKSTKPTLVLELGPQTTQSFIVSTRGIEAARPIAVGLDAMVPVIQKELGLKDEESARKLFFSNTFDFSGMGAALCKKLMKELQSSMGFYEVQTGQSIALLTCTILPEKLLWLEAVIAAQLGVSVLSYEIKPWLDARNISLAPAVDPARLDARRLSALGLLIAVDPLLPDANPA